MAAHSDEDATLAGGAVTAVAPRSIGALAIGPASARLSHGRSTRAEATAARFAFEPGWRWSECVKPVAGTESCQARHVGVVHSGRLAVTHEDGTELEIGPGEAYVIEPGHDAWVVGDEGFVGFEFESRSAEEYAKG